MNTKIAPPVRGLHEQFAQQPNDVLAALYRRPGFLIRRAHQIVLSLFHNAVEPLAITTTQFATLEVLRAYRYVDQAAVAGILGIDRSTTGLVIEKLLSAGYIHRERDPNDKRRKLLVLAKEGREVINDLAEPIRRANERAMSPFTPKEAEMLIVLLARFVSTFNDEARVPIKPSNSDD
jgi:DNA-binding MarR family transcriptional regulator